MTYQAKRRTPPKPTRQKQPDLQAAIGVWSTHIDGRYRPIRVDRLAMYWSCYKAGHITYRQLRVLFAAEEMAERRRYTAKPEQNGERQRKPRYTIAELRGLVGGRGSASADAALRADLSRLAKVGLLTFTEHELVFAGSIAELQIEDRSVFQSMIGRLPHKRRPVPVPRRILRAIAGQFPAGVTAVTLATLIRGVFWHKRAPEQAKTLFDDHTVCSGAGEGAFRLDHRTKREWIAETFGVSLRTVTASRQTLIDLGWIVPLETPQWLLNRYGAHDRINHRWGGTAENDTNPCNSASPSPRSARESASPRHDQNPSSSRNLKTRKPAPERAGPAGVSTGSTRRGLTPHSASAKRKHPAKPNIRDIRMQDLSDTTRLLQLHEQAVRLGLSDDSEASRLDFVSLAERARARGERAGAMFYWLIRERKTAFITQHCEDQAQRRLKAYRHGEGEGKRSSSLTAAQQGAETEYTADQHFVFACLRVAKLHRIDDPCRIAEARGWARDTWEEALQGLGLDHEQIAQNP